MRRGNGLLKKHTGRVEHKVQSDRRLAVMDRLSLYMLFIWVSGCSEAFNMDTEHPLRFNNTQEGFFGYSVLQYHSENVKWIIVGAPLRNSTGKTYTCTTNLEFCEALQPGSETITSFGMAAAVSSTGTRPFTSCSPYLEHECDGNSYLNGICYQYNSNLKLVSDFTAGFQECTKREVNLVFLFDGSSSMKPEEFEMNKKFIVNIMAKLSNSSIKFAAVQFSKFFSTVFDFNDYQNGVAKEKLMKEPRMKSLTNTYGAFNYTLNSLLNNMSSGANPNATKAVVIITDGEPTDFDNNKNSVLSKYEKQNVLRYIIGIGRVNVTQLLILASEPKINNTFFINEYAGLQGLLDNLQKKIYNIEGSQEAHSRDRQNELSQSGFSAVYHTVDSVIVGSVGSNDWQGVLYEVTGSGFTKKEIKDPAVSKDSYMGYSAVVGRRDGVSLLFSGAPRAEHTGLVTHFAQRENTWTVQERIPGEQIGSYFGAALSLLDVDSDGESDFLLVGAPLFYQSQPRREGRLYVYTLSEKPFQKMLNVCESNTGRFAASLASLKDLNGDGLSDVAVGAPLEDEWTGVVYIYLGDGTYGINPKRSPQRIPARWVSPGLQQFGVSVVGQMDMSDDNLTDIVIGAHGGIVLLKARPVMTVSLQLSFSPKEISIHHFDCSDTNLFLAFNLTSCFTVSERTSSKGLLNKSLNITLNINLDVVREMNRGFLKQQNSMSRSLQMSVLLVSNFSCSNFPIFMSRCVFDTESPLKIRMNFSQSEMLSGNNTAVLDIHSRTEEFVEVPFERSCNSSSCMAHLKLNFSFTNDTLLVVNQAHFAVLVSLANTADDSFNTSIVLHYSEGLSLSKFETVKPSRTRSSCGGQDSSATNRTTCSINLPVYRSGTTTHFLGMFRVKWDYDWPDMMDMIITANSDNNGNTTDSTVRRSVAVQLAVDLAVSVVGEDSVTYLNFSLEDRGPKPLTIIYKVENLGVIGLPVSVILVLPCKIPDITLTFQSFIMRENLTQCQQKQDDVCGKFECGHFPLPKSMAVHFRLTAQAALDSRIESKHSFTEIRREYSFNISAYLHYNQSRYNQTSVGLKDDPLKSQTEVKVEFVVLPSKWLIGCIGAGGGLILIIIILVLLLKCGFFKRKRPEEFEANENVFERSDSALEGAPLINSSAKENGEMKSGDGGMDSGDGGMDSGDGGMDSGDGGMDSGDGGMDSGDGGMDSGDGGISATEKNGMIENCKI